MRQRIPSALAPAAYATGLLYEAVIRVRTRLYSASLLPTNRLPAPVISIGNITTGGTGKTPLVIYVARTLSDMGCSPAVLTRGYGRARSGRPHILSPGETVPSPSRTLGDEPALIRRHIPAAWMGVSKNRFLTGTILSKRDRRIVFILDDGFQHLKLHRDLDVVILDSSQALSSNRIFPRGTLREPLAGLQRCDVFVINGSGDTADSRSVETEVRRWNREAEIFECRQIIRSLLPFSAWAENALKPGALSGASENKIRVGRVSGSAGTARTAPSLEAQPSLPAPAYLVSAVGNPERFQRDIRRLGIDVRGARFFADHYRLKEKDWRDCIQAARRSGAGSVITTEKDAVKIEHPPDFPLLVAVQSTEFSDASAFESVLKKSIEERR